METLSSLDLSDYILLGAVFLVTVVLIIFRHLPTILAPKEPPAHSGKMPHKQGRPSDVIQAWPMLVLILVGATAIIYYRLDPFCPKGVPGSTVNGVEFRKNINSFCGHIIMGDKSHGTGPKAVKVVSVPFIITASDVKQLIGAKWKATCENEDWRNYPSLRGEKYGEPAIIKAGITIPEIEIGHKIWVEGHLSGTITYPVPPAADFGSLLTHTLDNYNTRTTRLVVYPR